MAEIIKSEAKVCEKVGRFTKVTLKTAYAISFTRGAQPMVTAWTTNVAEVTGWLDMIRGGVIPVRCNAVSA